MTAITDVQPQVFKTKSKRTNPFALGWVKSLLLTLPIFLLSALMMFSNVASEDQNTLFLIPYVIVWAAMSVGFFLMLYTGKTDRYRAIFFIAMAISLPLAFIPQIIETRGNLALTDADMLTGATPFCHLVIPMLIVPAIATGTIIFPGSLTAGFASIAQMIILWLGSSLALGKGWCSWVCFYGGYDDACSRLRKKPKIKNIDRKWTYLPYAVLAVIVLVSAVTLSPTYCEWLCPFKAVTEFAAVTSVTILIQTIIFLAIFFGLVIVLPILTKRRTQCGLFCPLGAMQNITNKVNIYEMRIDTEKCTKCGHCLTNCPTFSLDESSMETGRTLISCVKCGKCADVCPKHAVSFHIKGTPVGATPNAARVLFLYPAYLMMIVMGSGNVASAIYRILKLITTGSMI